MSDFAYLLALLGYLTSIPLTALWAMRMGGDESCPLRIARLLTILWAVVFGPFVLRTWVEALLS